MVVPVRVGILGATGPLGRGLALRLAVAGTAVTLGSREPERAAALAAELLKKWPKHSLAIEGTGNPAAADEEIVVAATPWEAAVPTVRQVSGPLEGKVVVSVGNALVKQGREMLALGPPRSSVALALEAALPKSTVVAACHHLPAQVLEDLDAELECDVLVCSDNTEAKALTVDLLGSVEGIRALDAGSLAASSAIEAFTAVLVTLNMRYKAHTTLRLAGLDHVGRGASST